MRLTRGAVLNSALFRPALAVVLGTLTFWIGFIHLVKISTRLTARVFFGEAPAGVVATLEKERQLRLAQRSAGSTLQSSARDSQAE